MYGRIHTIYSTYTVDWPVQRPSVLENQLPERGNSTKTRLNHKHVRVFLRDKCEISPLFHCSSRSASLFETSLRSVRIAIITRDQCIPRSHSRDQCIHLLYPEISPFETSEVQISAFLDGHREISVLCTELCKFSAFPSRSLSNQCVLLMTSSRSVRLRFMVDPLAPSGP